jgi:hypothetical protein
LWCFGRESDREAGETDKRRGKEEGKEAGKRGDLKNEWASCIYS